MMRPAAEEFAAKAKDFKFNKPACAFYSNVTGKELDLENTDMIAQLAAHIVSPVKFTSELYAAQEAGFDTFIELGPNKVLTGLVKKTLADAKALNIENNATLDAALEALKAE